MFKSDSVRETLMRWHFVNVLVWDGSCKDINPLISNSWWPASLHSHEKSMTALLIKGHTYLTTVGSPDLCCSQMLSWSWYLNSLSSSLWRIFEDTRWGSSTLAKSYKSRGGSERSWCGMGSIIPLSVLLFELSATWDDHRLMVAQIGAHQE